MNKTVTGGALEKRNHVGEDIVQSTQNKVGVITQGMKKDNAS